MSVAAARRTDPSVRVLVLQVDLERLSDGLEVGGAGVCQVS
jgi:hypothetical protein